MEYHSIHTLDHSRLVATLQKITNDLQIAKRFQEGYTKQLKESVKPFATYYHDLATNGIPKTKAIYYKKASQEQGEQGSKLYKIQKDVEQSEHAYRIGIVHLELAREQLELARQHTAQVFVILCSNMKKLNKIDPD
jgi:hypothetical protein